MDRKKKTPSQFIRNRTANNHDEETPALALSSSSTPEASVTEADELPRVLVVDDDLMNISVF